MLQVKEHFIFDIFLLFNLPPKSVVLSFRTVEVHGEAGTKMKVFIALIAVLSATRVGALQNDSEVVRELTDGTFESYLTVSNLAIVDFFAPWCPHCQSFAPTFEKIAAQAQGKKLNVFFAKVDCAGKGKKVCSKLNIKFLPTIKMFSDGNSLGDYNGSRKPGAIMEFLEKAVQSPNDVKMLMSDDMGSKIPSNVSPWHANEKIHR